MKDILLDKQGDIALTAEGDISLVTSPVQAVMIKLKWVFAEWVFDPEKGIPWFDVVLVKKADIGRIKRLLDSEMMVVDDVLEVPVMDISFDPGKRTALVKFQFRTSKETFNEEVVLHG